MPEECALWPLPTLPGADYWRPEKKEMDGDPKEGGRHATWSRSPIGHSCPI
jgi:hypothetical protein